MVSGNVTPMLAIVGQVTGNYKGFEEDGLEADFSLHTFAGGLRVLGRGAQANPFAHVLFGGVRTSFSFEGDDDCDDCSDTSSMMMLGGGVNLFAQAPVGLRLGADWIHAFGDNGGNVPLRRRHQLRPVSNYFGKDKSPPAFARVGLFSS